MPPAFAGGTNPIRAVDRRFANAVRAAGTNGLASDSPSHSPNDAASRQTFLKLHLLKEKIGNDGPQAGILKTQFADLAEPTARDRRIDPVRLAAWRRRTVCGARLAPAMVSHDAHAQGLVDVAVELTLNSHLLRLTELGCDFRFCVTFSHFPPSRSPKDK